VDTWISDVWFSDIPNNQNDAGVLFEYTAYSVITPSRSHWQLVEWQSSNFIEHNHEPWNGKFILPEVGLGYQFRLGVYAMNCCLSQRYRCQLVTGVKDYQLTLAGWNANSQLSRKTPAYNIGPRSKFQ
jgi:hypothetical protein